MKKALIFCSIVYVCILFFSCSKNCSDVPLSLLNLNFEEIRHDSLPSKWGGVNDNYYSYSVVNDKKYNYVKITNINNSDTSKYGTFSQAFPTELVKGKNIMFSAEIKTQKVMDGYAGLWWRVGGADGVLGFDNMSDRGITGDTEWQKVSIEMYVEKDVENILFGGLLTGSGNASFRNLEIFIEGVKFEDTDTSHEPTRDEIAWLKQYIYPLTTSDPVSGNNDLKILDKLIGDASVVALGESTHGSREIFQMKHRIFKYLAENKGFDIFSIEANMPESYRLNDYILKGQGDPKELINGMYFWTWSTEEVFDMVEWMKQYHDAGGKIEFTGFDMQFYQGPILELQKAYEKDPAVNKAIEKLKKHLDNYKRYDTNNTEKTDEEKVLLQLTHEVGCMVEDSKFEEKHKEWLRRNVRIITQMIGYDRVIRDKAMAENLIWIKKINQESKIVTWAHNGHIQKKGPYMGRYLEEELGDDHINIGFATSEGTYTAVGKGELSSHTLQLPYKGTYEYYFNSLEEPIFILDLKSAKKDTSEYGKWLNGWMKFRGIGAMAMDEQFYPTNITEDFDYIIFIKKTNHSILLP